MLDFLLKWSRCLPPSPALGGVVIPRDKLPSNQFPHTYKLCSPFRFPPSTLSRPPTYPQALQSINLAQPNAEETLWKGVFSEGALHVRGIRTVLPHTPPEIDLQFLPPPNCKAQGSEEIRCGHSNPCTLPPTHWRMADLFSLGYFFTQQMTLKSWRNLI